MAVVPPAGVNRLIVNNLFSDSPWINVFHVFTDDPIVDQDTADNLCSDLVSLYIDSLQPLLTEQTICQGGHIYCSDGSTILEGTATASAAGGGTGAICPSGTAAVVSWLGGWHYRGGKPRSYLSGMRSGNLTGPHTWTGDFLAALAADALSFLEGVNALSGTGYPVVTLGALLGAGPAAAGTFAPFTGVRANPSVCSQRRRNNST